MVRFPGTDRMQIDRTAHGVSCDKTNLPQSFKPVSKQFEHGFGNETGIVDKVDRKVREHDGRQGPRS
jgi:hypothetical protein